MAVVYLATNKINGKRYIGATVKTLAARRYAHVCDAMANRKGCRVFNAAIRKYGRDAFEWVVLYEFGTREEAFTKEIELIASLKPEYNLTKGGQGIIGLKRTEQWKQRISGALKGRKPSPERIALLDRIRPDSRKSVVCVNDGKFFKSINDAGIFYGLNPSCVGRVTRGIQHSVGKNLHFVFSAKRMTVKQCIKIIKDEEKRKDGFVKRRHSKARPVIRLNDDVLFVSVHEAARECGLSAPAIVINCTSGRAARNGYRFAYADLEIS